MDHLIIVPCHSIWTDKGKNGNSQDEWALADFQLEGNDHLCFIEHLVKAVEALDLDKQATLVISGGETKEEKKAVSEAKSYYVLGEKIIKNFDSLQARIYLETFARDSFENVLFLICRYKEVKGVYPTHISIFGFEFKKNRFTRLHLEQALKFPLTRVTYIGNSPRPTTLSDEDLEKYYKELESSELKFAVQPFSIDWYGIKQPLATKRSKRNPFKRKHSYFHSNPELSDLLTIIDELDSPLSNEEVRDTIVFPWI